MVGPAARVDEKLDDHGHEQEAAGREPGREPNDQQHREDMLGRRRQIGGDIRREQRDLVLLAEQHERVFANVKTLNLGLPGAPEHAGDREARDQRGEAVWDELGGGAAVLGQSSCLLHDIAR